MTILLNLPMIHFDFGAVKALATELTRLSIDRPLVMTDRNLVESVFNGSSVRIPTHDEYKVIIAEVMG